MKAPDKYKQLIEELQPSQTQLVIVSKTRPLDQVRHYYDLGHRDFAENRVQALLERRASLPDDIRWHMIGHLQRNKVKDIAPFIHCIHSCDSMRLAIEINKQAEKVNRVLPILLQLKVAQEDSKYGFDYEELSQHVQEHAFQLLEHIVCHGIMAMVTFTDQEDIIHHESDKAQN